MIASNFRLLASGFGWPEGPVVTPEGNILVVDPTTGWITEVDGRNGKKTPYVETRGGPNGLAYGPDGALYCCRTLGLGDMRTGSVSAEVAAIAPPAGIVRIGPDRSVEELYVECDGVPLYAPNDIVFDAHGGFYFTDFGGTDGRATQPGGVFYADTTGSKIIELIHEPAFHVPLASPNGIGLSLDGSTLYLAETATGRLWSYAIDAIGSIDRESPGWPYFGAHLVFAAPGEAGFDSLAIDSRGFVCVATNITGGITVIDPSTDELVERVVLPDGDLFVSNICFGGPDLRTAYITAGNGNLWACDWAHPGLPLNTWLSDRETAGDSGPRVVSRS